MIHINSVLNKDKIHPYYKIKCSYQLAKKQSQVCVHSIIMVRFRDKKKSKRKVLCCRKTYKNL